MLIKNTPRIINPSIQFQNNIKQKKKHLIPICRVISKIDNEKENIYFEKNKNKQQKHLIIENFKSRKFGNEIKKFSHNKINLSNYLQNKNNSFKKLNISREKSHNNSCLSINDSENLNFKIQNKIISKPNSNLKLNFKTRNQILQKIKKLSYRLLHNGKSHPNIFKNNCLKTLTIRNSSKEKHIKNNIENIKQEKSTRIKNYSLSHQSSLTKILTIKQINNIEPSSLKKIKLPIPNTNINIDEKLKNKTLIEFNKNKENQKINNSQEKDKKTQNKKESNPQFVSEYSEKIFENLLKEEKNFIEIKGINNKYMKNQKEINPEMRSILNNWLIEVHDKFNYNEQTLFICINLIDRYLSIKKIERANYQLVGICALFIACKHEEINLPNPKDFLFITENAYSKEQLFKMEYDILNSINFEVLIPTQLDFYLYLSYKFDLSEKEDLLGKYLLNICLIDYNLIKYPFSIVACSCLYISMKWFKKKDNNILSKVYNNQYFNGNNLSNINVKNCIGDIYILFENMIKTDYQSAKGKYSQDKYKNISLLIVETKKNENIV